MRMPSSIPSSIFALLTLFPSLITAITLTTIQPISGFSTTCDDAYNTPLSGCSASDFSSGDCSMDCISFLEALTKVLNADCTGTSAYPNTLIAAFFNGQGTETLCPNVLNGGGSGSRNSGGSAAATSVPAVLGHQGGEASVATYAKYSFSAVPPSTATTTTSTSSTSSSATAPSNTANSDATTTEIIFAKTTVVPEATPPINPNLSLSTSSSSTSTSTSKSSGNGGGAGTILDVGSDGSGHSVRIETWVLLLLAGSAGLLGLL